jgi:hypothetical protein
MDYIYDIILNFQNNYYEFYEWKKEDKLINIKKILIYKISNEDYLKLKHNDVVIDIKEFPKQIKMMLVTNGEEVMGILFEQSGKVIKRSSLLLDESEEILEEKEIIKNIKIKFLKNTSKKKILLGRIAEEQSFFLEDFLSKIDLNKDKYLLKYIYYDIYQEEEDNPKIIQKKLEELMNTNNKELYNSIQKINKNYCIEKDGNV